MFRFRASRALLVLAGAAWALSLCGCGLQRPRVFNPGPVLYQQYNAALHDPYPDNDAGPPVEGGRPREFRNPLAEPVRTRWLSENRYYRP